METTNEVVSVTLSIPKAYQSIAFGLGAIGVLLIVFLLYRFIRTFRALRKLHKKAPKTQEKKKRKKSDPHTLVAELHEALIAEMRGTSRQNTIMIALTVVFITVSIFSARIYMMLIEAPDKIINLMEALKALIGK